MHKDLLHSLGVYISVYTVISAIVSLADLVLQQKKINIGKFD